MATYVLLQLPRGVAPPQKAGLRSKTKRRFRVKTTDSKHNHPIAPDRLGQDFGASAANQVWVSDITYIPTDEGCLYLASTMDLFTTDRRSGDGIDLARLDRRQRAVHGHRAAQPAAGLIHHSDRGVQYASAEFRAVLNAHGLLASVSRTGNCYDNAVKESLFRI